MIVEEFRDAHKDTLDAGYADPEEAYAILVRYLQGGGDRRTPGRLQVLQDVLGHGVTAQVAGDMVGKAIVQHVDLRHPRPELDR